MRESMNTRPASARVLRASRQAGLDPSTLDPRRAASIPPADLKDVVDELAKISVTDLKLAAQTVVQSSGREFRIEATPRLDNPCELTVTGEALDEAAPQPRMRLSLEALEYEEWHLRTGRDASRRMQTRDLCTLETTVSAPPGHAVVLGVTPTQEMTSVFVLQILPEE